MHYGRLYGARAKDLIGGAASLADLGRHHGGLLYEAEVRYLVAKEWAQTPEDILVRAHQTLSAHDRDASETTFSPPGSRASASPTPPEDRRCRLTLSLNTNPLVNRFADPDDLIDTVARDLRIRDLQLTHEFINPSWPAPVIRRLTRQMPAALAAHRRARHQRHDRALRPAQPFRPSRPRRAPLLRRLVQDLRRHHRRSRRRLRRHAIRDLHLSRISTIPRGAKR